MTALEFRKKKEYAFNHFLKLTGTGIGPDYLAIDTFAQEYHEMKLELLKTKTTL